jgi:hypothetical protein
MLQLQTRQNSGHDAKQDRSNIKALTEKNTSASKLFCNPRPTRNSHDLFALQCFLIRLSRLSSRDLPPMSTLERTQMPPRPFKKSWSTIGKITTPISMSITSTSKLFRIILLGEWNLWVLFNSHSLHHAMALWALGAPKEAIKTAYDANRPLLKPAIPPVEVITASNFQDHLGKKE